MSFSIRSAVDIPAVLSSLALSVGATIGIAAPASAADLAVTPAQRSTAQQVAQAGVALSELAPNAPDSHTVKSGDTLWGVSRIFLKSPWRWPELWGMNLTQIKNPHLIYPGQVLYLDKSTGRARLRLGQPVAGVGNSGTVKLSPRVRSGPLSRDGIPMIPLELIQPFLNEAVVFDTDALVSAPRIVATTEEHVLLSKGDLAYVRGDVGNFREFRVFRTATPLADPTTKEVLGYEAAFLGTAEFERPGESRTQPDGKPLVVPDTFVITSVRREIGTGDRLSPVPPKDYDNYTPHAPNSPIAGQIISIYGDAFTAGQNQIVALNRGQRDGIERGHVLALWRDGQVMTDRTDGGHAAMKLPDERNGMLFVFRVFDRVSYALILETFDPVKPSDRFTQP